MKLGLCAQVGANLWSTKMRSLLALLGVLIGTAAVVALISSGELATRTAIEQLRRMGTDLISVSVYGLRGDHSAQSGSVSSKEVFGFSNVLGVKWVAPSAQWPVSVMASGRSVDASVLGVTPAWAHVARFDLEAGRFLTDMDAQRLHCVVGAEVSKNMRRAGVFPVLGAWVQVGNQHCQIVGVGRRWPSNFFIMANLNRSLMLPLTMVQSLSNASVEIHDVAFKVMAGYATQVVQNQLQSRLKQWKPKAQIYFKNPEALIEQVTQQRQTLTILLGVIGGISLLVGGVGIMNIMLVALAERKHEIGLRMALGATQRDIRQLFLAEAVVLTVAGGVLGILIGSLGVVVIAWISAWHYTFLVIPVVIGFIVSCLVGVFFGFYPAYRASLLEPIVALRSGY